MKTKMKTILSVCVLSIFLYACSKNNPTPDPVLDCIDLLAVDGVAVLDDCGNCHQSYIYGGFAHNHSVEYISDTSGLVLEDGYQLIFAGSAADIANNPGWNGGPLTAIDSCGDCHRSYIYGGFEHNHSVEYISDTSGLVLEDGYQLIFAGSAADIANNPGWDAGCK